LRHLLLQNWRNRKAVVVDDGCLGVVHHHSLAAVMAQPF
jgi:hypothetical protein